jgi:hypothetical protein
MADKRNASVLLVRESEANKMDIKEIRWMCVNWTHLSRDRYDGGAVVKTVMNLWVP